MPSKLGRAACLALIPFALLAAPAVADPVLTASSSVRADSSVSMLANWSCAAPFRTCSYGWYEGDAKIAGGYRSHVAQPGVFAKGCHTVQVRVSYWYGRETSARKQVADTTFCIS